jgi:hypothetical protein
MLETKNYSPFLLFECFSKLVEIVGYLIPTRGIASPLIKYDRKRLINMKTFCVGVCMWVGCVSIPGWKLSGLSNNMECMAEGEREDLLYEDEVIFACSNQF